MVVKQNGASSEEQRAMSLRLLTVLQTSIALVFQRDGLVPFFHKYCIGIQVNFCSVGCKDTYCIQLGFYSHYLKFKSR